MKILNYIQILLIIVLLIIIVYVIINKKSENYTLTLNTASSPKFAVGTYQNPNTPSTYKINLLSKADNIEYVNAMGSQNPQPTLKNFVSSLTGIDVNSLGNVQGRRIFTIASGTITVGNYINYYLFSDINGNVNWKQSNLLGQTSISPEKRWPSDNNYYWIFIEISRTASSPAVLSGYLQHIASGGFVPPITLTGSTPNILSKLVDNESQAGLYNTTLFNYSYRVLTLTSGAPTQSTIGMTINGVRYNLARNSSNQLTATTSSTSTTTPTPIISLDFSYRIPYNII